ncbi:hypothetical protein THTE_0101 [Thermogutta terrifontis]|uniref:Uncharacterized protein n=1 Tax=Thermogutta terrifontis TaxID=1331910 RepID=A0A286R9T1_9BACT|nr:hypothetical protein THTE_0101 [Thermogutta terrifontis]
MLPPHPICELYCRAHLEFTKKVLHCKIFSLWTAQTSASPVKAEAFTEKRR